MGLITFVQHIFLFVEHIKDLDELNTYFDDEEFVSELLENGEHIGELLHHHLVEVN